MTLTKNAAAAALAAAVAFVALALLLAHFAAPAQAQEGYPPTPTPTPTPAPTHTAHTFALPDGSALTLNAPIAPTNAGDALTLTGTITPAAGVTINMVDVYLRSDRDGHGGDLLRQMTRYRTIFTGGTTTAAAIDPITITSTSAAGLHTLRGSVDTGNNSGAISGVVVKVAHASSVAVQHVHVNPAHVVAVVAGYNSKDGPIWVFALANGQTWEQPMTENERLRGSHHWNHSTSNHHGKGMLLLTNARAGRSGN